MAARRGVTRDRVVHAALEVLDEVGDIDGVRPSMVAARLGIRSQSLYAHVDGVNGLRRLLALQSLADLADTVTGAAVGRSGPPCRVTTSRMSGSNRGWSSPSNQVCICPGRAVCASRTTSSSPRTATSS